MKNKIVSITETPITQPEKEPRILYTGYQDAAMKWLTDSLNKQRLDPFKYKYTVVTESEEKDPEVANFTTEINNFQYAVVKPVILMDGNGTTVTPDDLQGQKPLYFAVHTQNEEWIADLPTEEAANNLATLLQSVAADACRQEQRRSIGGWAVEDVIEHAQDMGIDLSTQQAQEIFDSMEFDATGFGWDDIEASINNYCETNKIPQ